MRRVLDRDPVLGITRYFHWHDGKFTIETVQDVGGIVEANKRQFNSHDGKRFGRGFMHHVGRIPVGLYYQYLRTHDETAVKKFLNLSGNKAWKTHPGSV